MQMISVREERKKMSEKVKCEDCVFAPFKDIAKDRINVVRCKDCKHKSVKGKTTRYHYCEIWKSAVDETDFCSQGERR